MICNDPLVQPFFNQYNLSHVFFFSMKSVTSYQKLKNDSVSKSSNRIRTVDNQNQIMSL